MKISETDLILNPDGSVYHLSLLPEHIANTIITVGDPDRVQMVAQFFDSVEFTMNKREFITSVGTFKGKRITVISTGIGTDNVELFFTELDALVNVNLKTREPNSQRKRLRVIRIGTSGSLQENVAVGSHLISDYSVGFDNVMSFYLPLMDGFEEAIAVDLKKKLGLDFAPYVVKGSEALMQQIGGGLIKGNTVTCPGFYAPQGRMIRTPIRYPNLIEGLNSFRSGDFFLSNFEMETAGYYAMARLLGHEAISVNAILANRIKNEFSNDPNQVVKSLILKVLDRI